MRLIALKNSKCKAAYVSMPLLLLFAGSVLADNPVSNARGLSAKWQSYGRNALMPKYSWAIRETTLDGESALQNAMRERLVPAQFKRTAKGFTLESTANESVGASAFAPLEQSALTIARTSLISGNVRSGWSKSIGDDSEIYLSGVFAYQQFSSPNLGVSRSDGVLGVRRLGLGETSSGVGGSFGLREGLTDNLAWSFNWQSKINMEPFKNARGIFGQPGEFDIPGTVGASLRYAVAPRHAFTFGVDRVDFSKIVATPTRALPDRLLVLISDIPDLQLQWKDLTVYSMQYAIETSDSSAVAFRYSTNQQPEPTKQRLRDALQSAYSNKNFGLQFIRSFGVGSDLNVSANYVPTSQIWSPSVFGRKATDVGHQFELEANWHVSF
jgi:hypothetical protein